MSARPTITVHSSDGKHEDKGSIPLPAVFTAPIRNDLVLEIHSAVAKNRRQPQGVSLLAGHQTSAESWGTGRAVSRIPRVGGSGTHRSGQGAFGNMCRGGHMFAPLKTYRKWQQKSNLKQKRHAVASALAASAVAPLVMARGHKIEGVAEIPYVVDALDIAKTKDLVKTLVGLGLEEELRRVALSRKVRTGRGKMRNRRYVTRRGPLIVYDDGEEIITQSSKNLMGVDTCNVHRLNILKLAPGGHLGRLIIWTKNAFSQLNDIFGTYRRAGEEKGGYRLQRNIITTADVAKLINSDEIQSAIRAPRTTETHRRKKNALRNKSEMNRLNPFAAKKKELVAKQEADRHKTRQARLKAKRKDKAARKAGQNFYSGFMNEQAKAYAADEEAWEAGALKEDSDEEDDGSEDDDDDDDEESDE